MTKRKSRRKRVRMPRKKFPVNRLWLDTLNEAFICEDIASFGGGFVTAKELRLRFPMRYDEHQLPRTLTQMAKVPEYGTARLRRKRSGWNGLRRGWAYALTEVESLRQGRRAA